LKQIKKWIKRSLWFMAATFVCMNMVAAFHAYTFTHFAASGVEKTSGAKKITTAQKVEALIFGVSNPRPENKRTPIRSFETVKLQSNKEIECWSMKTENAQGTVILFHGFGGCKSLMLDKANIFLRLHYNVFLVDFMGAGGSAGSQTTIGFLEAAQVKTCFDYITAQGEQNVYLFGTSMGAVATMKAINDYKINPKGIIIECPFGSMYQTVCARFNMMNVPSFPMAGLLVFWGGVQNGFWAFDHNPSEYAKQINIPVLLLYGAEDKKVSRGEIDEIFNNLSGKKRLKVYEKAGHENYLIKYEAQWERDVQSFLKSL